MQLDSGIVKTNVSDLNNVDPSGVLGVAYMAQRPGDTFTLVFVGSYVGICAVVGPSSGTLLLTLDGGVPTSLDGGVPTSYTLFSTFDRNIRPGFFPLLTNLPTGRHTLIVDVSPDIPDKVGIMAAQNLSISAEYQNKTDFTLVAFCVL